MYVRSPLLKEEFTATYRNRAYLTAAIVSVYWSIYLSSYNIIPRKLVFNFTSIHFTVHSSLSCPPHSSVFPWVPVHVCWQRLSVLVSCPGGVYWGLCWVGPHSGSAPSSAVRPAFPLIDLVFPAAPEHAKGRAYESITSLAHSWLWGAPELCGSLQLHLSLTDLRNAKKLRTDHTGLQFIYDKRWGLMRSCLNCNCVCVYTRLHCKLPWFY